MAIEELLREVPPPKNPVEKGDPTRWDAVQRDLGIPLPADYRDFGIHYGTGSFPELGDLGVLNPFSVGFVEGLNSLCAFLRHERGLTMERNTPYGVFPDLPGWLPFACDGLGFTLCWVTEGNPDDWPILLVRLRETSFQQIQMSLTSFLTQLARGQLTTIFGDGRGHERESFTVHFVPRESCGRPHGVRVQRAEGDAPPQIEWSALDQWGRPTGARVLLGPNCRRRWPYEPFTVYPSWWPELPASGQPWVRQHLVGWRLGGPGQDALHNLIPLTLGAHLSLRYIEGMVSTQVHENHQHLVYEIALRYDAPQNRYPTEVILSADPAPGTGSTWMLCPTLIRNYPRP